MKQIVAIVKPFLAEKVLEALRRAPLEACSVREVKGTAGRRAISTSTPTANTRWRFCPRSKSSLWVDDARVEEIVRKIVEVARTGRMGDGKIFVLPAEPYEAVIDISS